MHSGRVQKGMFGVHAKKKNRSLTSSGQGLQSYRGRGSRCSGIEAKLRTISEEKKGRSRRSGAEASFHSQISFWTGEEEIRSERQREQRMFTRLERGTLTNDMKRNLPQPRILPPAGRNAAFGAGGN